MGTFVPSAAFALVLAACGANQTREGDAPGAGGAGLGGVGSGGSPASGGASNRGGMPSFGGGASSTGGAGVATGGSVGSGGSTLSAGASAGGAAAENRGGSSSQAGSSSVNSGGSSAALGGRSSVGNGGASAGNAGQTGAAGAAGAAGAGNGAYRWGAVALGGGGFVSAVVASVAEKNVFFARTDVGGFYRWNEASSSWLPLSNFASEAQTGFLGVESVALDPQTPGRVYALVGIDYFNGGKSAILRSTDNGDSFSITDVTAQFKAHGNGMGRQNGERLAVDPNLGNVLFCGTRRNGLWKSSDFGATWQAASGLPVTTTANDNGIALVLFDAASGARGAATPRLFAGISRLNAPNFYVSTNGGASFSPVPGAPATTQMPQRAVIASNGTLYVTFANGAGPHGNTSGSEPMNAGSIWKLNIAQGTWTNITPAGVTAAFSGISVDAQNPNHLVATTINTYVKQAWGYGDRIYVSSDGGSNWSDPLGENKATMDANGMPWIVNHAIHWAGTATFDPNDSNRVFVTSGNGVFATNNLSAASSTWKFMAKGLEETVPLEAVSVPSVGLAVVMGDYDGFVSRDARVSPAAGTYVPAMGSTGALSVAGAKPEVWARAATKIYRSANSGGQWSELPRPNAQTGGQVALSADGNVLVWTPDKSSTAYRTANAGTQWSPVGGVSFAGPIVADSVNPARFYAYNPASGSVLLSNDGAVSFTPGANAGSGGSTKPRTAPGVEGELWIPLYNGGLARSSDGGKTFTKVVNVSQCGAVGFGKAAPGETFPTVFIWGKAGSGPSGIYRSLDAGASFQRVNDDQHQFGGPGNGQFVSGDANVFGRVYMSTAGLGVVYGEPN